MSRAKRTRNYPPFGRLVSRTRRRLIGCQSAVPLAESANKPPRPNYSDASGKD
jgi:hypothetical protein